MTNHPEEQISAYIDDELSEQDRQEIAKHIESCASCQGLLEELLVLQSDVSQTYRMLQSPIELDSRILQAIQGEPTKKAEGKGWLSVPLIALMVLGSLWFMTSAVILKLLGGLLKLTVAIVYMVSHFISSVPVLAGLTLVLSLIVLSISGYSLKRLLQTTMS
jgi:anti-sigma factor RsiW